MIDREITNVNWGRIKICIIMLLMFILAASYSFPKQVANSISLISRLQEQANIMGQAFLKRDYQAFAKYTYPAIVKAMGGESRMATVLANSAINMETRGMTFDNITFDSPSKIVKSGNELQCTLQQYTTIKLENGRAIATSTLIAISKDSGKNWLFVDTSNKDEAAMRRALPNLSTFIIIPPQQKPVFYSL